MSVAWSADLGAAVRGQPLVVGGRVIAATERNRVVALDPRTGRVLWSTTIGRPLTHVGAVAGCGNIDPLGITSTPVIDTATGTIYVVGEVYDGGRVRHELVGLDVASGATRLRVDVDPPLRSGESPVNLLQRPGLALHDGSVYVGFGGNFGDCGRYHGWLVRVRLTGDHPVHAFEVAPDGEGGAIWMSGGAPAIDAAGNVYVSTGNANPWPASAPDPLRYAESVVKLGPDLSVRASFKDPKAGGDADLSTGNPVLLPGGEVFAVGKTDIGYFLRQRDLSLVAAVPGVCGSDPDGGPAYDPVSRRLFVPCRGGGVQVIDVANHRLDKVLAGADSSPVVLAGRVWALDSRRGTLIAYGAATLATLQTLSVGSAVPVFASPSVGAGLLLVGTDRGVTAVR
jgi:hypothetical protein